MARMTLVAEPRHAHLQQVVVDGPVGFMTIGTIFANRRMLMKKRPSSLRMAGITIFVDALLYELRRIGCSVGIVAVRARQLSFP